jgi:hypothetical protein
MDRSEIKIRGRNPGGKWYAEFFEVGAALQALSVEDWHR